MSLRGNVSTQSLGASANSSSTQKSATQKPSVKSKGNLVESTINKIFICAALFFTVQGTVFCGILACSSFAGTIVAAASGVATPGIVPGIFSTCFFAGCACGAALLSAHLITQL